MHKHRYSLSRIELDLILISRPDSFIESASTVSFHKLSLESKSLIIFSHLAHCNACKGFLELLLGHPNDSILLIVVTKFVHQIDGPGFRVSLELAIPASLI